MILRDHVEIRRSTQADIDYLAEHMRPEDAAECLVSADAGPRESLETALALCDVCDTGLYKGTPAAMFGASYQEDTAWVWMLCSTETPRIGVTLMRTAPQWLRTLPREHWACIVWAKNQTHLEWLTKIGFEVTKIYESLGPCDEPFIQMEATRSTLGV